MSSIPFTKMHGAGNDFIVIDLRKGHPEISESNIVAMANRRLGIGCDQVVLISPPSKGGDICFRFHNADGSLSGACGNGTRCAAWMIMCQEGRRQLSIETAASILEAWVSSSGMVSVDMGTANTQWRKIPLARATDTLKLPLEIDGLYHPTAVGIGNPHCVFFVNDAESIDIEVVGPHIENHELFPERTNVEFVSVLPDERLRMRVWERGAGVTLACGTGVCAALVAAVRRSLIKERSAEVIVDGGVMAATWRDNQHVVLTGPVEQTFCGFFENSKLL